LPRAHGQERKRNYRLTERRSDMGNNKAKSSLKALLRKYEYEDCDKQSSLRDLLTDVRHLSDDLNLDFNKALRGSYEVYLEEKS